MKKRLLPYVALIGIILAVNVVYSVFSAVVFTIFERYDDNVVVFGDLLILLLTGLLIAVYMLKKRLSVRISLLIIFFVLAIITAIVFYSETEWLQILLMYTNVGIRFPTNISMYVPNTFLDYYSWRWYPLVLPVPQTLSVGVFYVVINHFKNKRKK